MNRENDNINLGTRIRQRWRKNTLREVYSGSDGKVTKRFWVRPGARRYPEPWLREHEALKRLGGNEFPRTYGIKERPFQRGREILFVRDFVDGALMGRVSIEGARQMGRLFARMHQAGVVMNDAALDNFVKDEKGIIRCIDFGCARVFQPRSIFLVYAAGKELSKLNRDVFSDDPGCWAAFRQAYFKELGSNALARCLTLSAYKVSRVARWLRKDLFGARLRMRRYELRYGIPKWREKSFERGSMLVLPTLECRGSLEAYISNLGFLDLPEDQRHGARGKSCRAYSFYLPAAQREVVLKVSCADPTQGFLRRMHSQIIRSFKDPAKKEFLGALELNRKGIRAAMPLAYWRHRPSGFEVERYFLCEKLPNDPVQ